MENGEIDIRKLKNAINDILDHMIEDLSLLKVTIDPAEDFYWDFMAPGLFDVSKPAEIAVGRLTDDVQFSSSVARANSGAVSYNLVHIAPLLRYIAEKVQS